LSFGPDVFLYLPHFLFPNDCLPLLSNFAIIVIY
jgi:hypothetical protein